MTHQSCIIRSNLALMLLSELIKLGYYARLLSKVTMQSY